MTKRMILFCVFAAVVYLVFIDSRPPVSEDTPVYILLAKSLVSGTGYTDICFVDAPPHTKYPFIYPLMLAPVVYFFGYNYYLIRLMDVLLAMASVLMVYAVFRKYLDASYAFIICALTAVSAKLLMYSYKMVSEIPFMLFLLLACYFAQKYEEDENWLGLNGLLLALSLILAYFTRSPGVFLFFGCALYFIIEKRRGVGFKKAMLIAVIFMVPALLWLIRNSVSAAKIPTAYLDYNFSSYAGEFIGINNIFNLDEKTAGIGMFISRVFKNLYSYIFYSIPKLVTGIEIQGRNVLALFLSIVIFAGFAANVLKKRTIIDYCFGIYLVFLLLWAATAQVGTRYLLPILPFLFYYLLAGINLISTKFGVRARNTAFVAVVTLVFLSNLFQIFNMRKEKDSGFIQMCLDIRGNLPQGVIFGSVDMAYWIYLYTGYKSGPMIPMTKDDKKVMDSIKKCKYDYLAVSPVFGRSYQYLKPVIENNKGKFSIMYQREGNVIYKLL